MHSVRVRPSLMLRIGLFKCLSQIGPGVLVGLMAATMGGAAQAAPPARVEFHQQQVERMAEPAPDLSRPMAVFAHVFAALDSEITVYPSEGYYYFSFMANGNLIRGNIRFSPLEAERQQISFAYFFDDEARNQPLAGKIPEGQMLGHAQGVTLNRTGKFSYTLSYAGRSVNVHIYDAARERANPPRLYPGEELVGPALDDSGVHFNLVFNQRSNHFYFLLNGELGHSEEYQQLDLPETGARILIGKRTRFAYVETPGNGRLYLIGVALTNISSNSHFDGPFDQLPDYFVDGNRLRDLIVRSEPDLAGALGPFGFFMEIPDSRYAIAPYIEYRVDGQLAGFAACGKHSEDVDAFTVCLDGVINPPPSVDKPTQAI